MANLEIPHGRWQLIQERAAQNSSEEVSWTAKAVTKFLGRQYEMDVTYHVRVYQGRLWLDMTAPYIDVPDHKAIKPRRRRMKQVRLLKKRQS